jgi:hypothetical protein
MKSIATNDRPGAALRHALCAERDVQRSRIL